MSRIEKLARLPEADAGPTAYRLLIDGEFVDGAQGKVIERVSPGHGVAVSRYAEASGEDVERALLAARRAFDSGPWPRMPAKDRARLLLTVADLLDGEAERLARLDAIESGKPIAQAEGEVAAAIDMWRYAAGLARDLHGESYSNLGTQVLGLTVREPIGVCALITPWNFPFLIASQKLPFVLAAGCTAVVKPSEMSSASTLVLGDVLMRAGLPPGVVNILVGFGDSVGAPVMSHPAVDMISFTGSTRVGKLAMKTAADTLKKVEMELGGKNAQIVFPDADFEAAVDAVLFGAYFNAGECCNAGSRLIVHKDIAEDFLAAFKQRAAHVKVGDPLDRDTHVGAIISPEHLGKIEGYIDDATKAGAQVALGGGRLESEAGYYMAPTVVTGVGRDMAIAREEVFGPVLSVLTFDTIDDAITLADATTYGLSSAVWSKDIDACMHVSRSVRTGTVWVNTFMDGYSELPFGGYKQSGIGRELGRHAVDEYTETKTIQFHRGERTDWWVNPRGS